MNRAFIFDMDGVLVDSEKYWLAPCEKILEKYLDTKVRAKIDSTVGIGPRGIFNLAKKFGVSIDFEKLSRDFDAAALDVYDHASITLGTEGLVEKLIKNNFSIGIVTSSPLAWVDRVVPRLSFMDKIATIVSIDAYPELKVKPAPDGFLKAFRDLKAAPARSFVLEDSSLGIQAGKASGAFTIGYRENLLPGYEQGEADAYADTMDDVIALVEKFTQR